MRVDITTTSDENFTLYVNGVENAPVPNEVVAGQPNVEENPPIVETTSVETPVKDVKDKSPNPTPLENPKSDRLGYFDGTSWDDGVRGHKF
jgi:hypothetical protein|tara:strand:+ start:3597 stop:3869 length:273 start_codon:yes stop_codon:yes gene_type:complete